MSEAEISKGKRKIVVDRMTGSKTLWLCIVENADYHRKIAQFPSYVEAYDFMEYLAEMLNAKKIRT